jgi:ABC-type antimicrobial peptide transport system permease subunit
MPGASTGSATPDAARFSDAQIGQIRGVGHVQSVENAYTFASATAEVGGKKAIIPSLSNWTDGYTSSSLAAGRSPKPGEVVLDKSVITSKIESANTWRRIIGKKITLSFITTDTNGSQATVTLQATVSGVTESSNEAMQITAVNTRTLIDALARQHVETSPSSLVVKADGLDKVTSIGTTINGFKQEGKRLYSSTSVASLIDTVQTYLSLATTILSAIAAISLVVSALMIIVTMYMSVSARTKEIGVLRALGESKGNIRMLFTAESFIIGVISALLAAALALGIGELANHLLARIANYSFIQITGVNVLTIFAISVMIALVASILPARHAASLNPIDALGRD